DLVGNVEPVFRIGGVDDHPTIANEPVAVRIARVTLPSAGDLPSGDVVAPAWLKGDELYRRRQLVERHREAGRILLAPGRFLDVLVAAVDPDRVSGNIGRAEEGKTHDMVPVHVRLEHVKRVLLRGAVAAEYMVPESAHPAAEVAQNVLTVAGIELHAR